MLKAKLFGVLLPLCLFGITEASTSFLRCASSEIGLRFPHPQKCGLFLRCTAASRIDIKQCPKGLHFNEQLQECDLPQRANCTKQVMSVAALCENCDCNVCCAACDTTKTTTIITTTAATTVSTKKSTTSTKASTTARTPTTTCGCIEEQTTIATTCTVVTETPSTIPCGCTDEQTTSSTTAPTTKSTKSTTTATTTSKTETTKISTTKTISTTMSTTTSSTLSTTSYSSTTACTAETPTTPPENCGCTAEGNNSTPDFLDDLPEPSITTTNPTKPTVPPIKNCDDLCCGQRNGVTLPLVGDCQRFIICQGQRKTVLTCPNNLHYSASTGQCDFPQNAACPWTYQAPSGPAAGPSGTHCNHGGRCVGQSDGTAFPNADNSCSSDYVVCQCECEVTRSCSAPLMFNPRNNVCDWAASFGC